MYVPPHFRQNDPEAIRAFVRASRLATLFSAGPGGPRASHVPVSFDPEPEPLGALHCHLARASLYATKRETGKVVPTWNYVAVHARGVARVTEDASELHALVSSLTDGREAERSEPWHVDDAPDTYVANQLRGIVGVTIPITHIDAKWKMSQNRTDADMLGVIDGLRASDVPS